LWVAFFGPDGVGKSAVIDRLQQKVEGEFSGCARFHFRPRFGCRRRDAAPMTAPHAQTPRGLLFSTCKLLYWLFDCWLGYIFQVLPSLRRSELVIFDRYLPDLLVDPVRYRLPASAMNLTAQIVKWVPLPDLCILLDAPAECVRQRKQEVSPAESRRQRAAYLRLFQSLPRSLVVNANCPIEQVAQNVSAAIMMLYSRSAQPESELSDCRLPT
jgi:thymidylate kinase